MPTITNLTENEQYQIWRKRNRVRLIDVANYCGCTAPAISQWENGLCSISDELKSKYDEFIEKINKKQVDKNNQTCYNQV